MGQPTPSADPDSAPGSSASEPSPKWSARWALKSWATMNNTAPMGMTDWARLAGTSGKADEAGPGEHGLHPPPGPSQHHEESHHHRLGEDHHHEAGPAAQMHDQRRNADVRPMEGREGSPVVGQPRQEDRRHFVVPYQGSSGLPEADSHHHDDGQGHHDEDHHGLQGSTEGRLGTGPQSVFAHGRSAPGNLGMAL